MAGLCPCCGYDLEKDEPISWAGFEMTAYGPARFHGAEIKLTQGQSTVLWTLVKARGGVVRKTAIAERLGYEGDTARRLVDTIVCRLRRILEPHGPVPIRTRWGVGVYIEG